MVTLFFFKKTKPKEENDSTFTIETNMHSLAL